MYENLQWEFLCLDDTIDYQVYIFIVEYLVLNYCMLLKLKPVSLLFLEILLAGGFEF